MVIGAYILVFLLKALYPFFKIFPINKNKILFLSRQSNKLTLDFKLIQEELKKQNNNLHIVTICKRVKKKLKDYFIFGYYLLKSMYHLATSKICVIDSYWPTVSVLKHKKDLKVIQIWHSIGKIKKSGYQTLGKEGGRNKKVAEILKMHKNYDLVIAGGANFNPFYCESMGISEDKILNIGLPRIDFLIKTEEENKKRVYEKYPEFKNKDKKIILYAPTFRRTNTNGLHELIKNIDFDKYILLVKEHMNQKLDINSTKVYTCDEFSAIELLSVCDYLITDYSAIALEAAILDKKTYYYLHDYEEYLEKNGLNIDLFKEMPGCTFKSAKDLMESINKDKYNTEAFSEYKRKYLPKNLGNSTKLLVELILKKWEEN